MNKIDRLALYGCPALAAIIICSSFAGLFRLLNARSAPAKVSIKAAAVKYAPVESKESGGSDEIAEIRAIHAADLFASSRADRFAALMTAGTNHPSQVNVTPPETPLFLSLPPVSAKLEKHFSPLTANKIDDEIGGLNVLPRPPGRLRHPMTNNPMPAIEFNGPQQHFQIDPDILKGLAPLTAQEPWSFQATVRFNGDGFADYIFAEAGNCGLSLSQGIIKRLYRCHFVNITQACEGVIAINYPTYAVNHSAVLPGPERQKDDSK